MKQYLPGHTQQKVKQWMGRQWYHQRFDGSPYFIHFIAEAELRTEKRKHGANFMVHYCFFEDGKADWYIEMDDIKKVYTAVIKAGQQGHTFLEDWKQDELAFENICQEIMAAKLFSLSDDELIQLHERFIEITLNRNTSSSLIDGFALGTDELVANQIKEIYEKSTLKNSLRFTEVFSTLTAPVHLSFINEAEVHFLKTIEAIQKNHPKNQERTLELLQQHQQKFFWIHNNYVTATILSVDYFKQEMDKFLHLKIDLLKEIIKIQDTPSINREKKNVLMQKLAIPEDLQLLLKISEDFTYWQDERKKATFWTTHCGTLLLEEIGRRVNIPADELKYFSPREVSTFFDKKGTMDRKDKTAEHNERLEQQERKNMQARRQQSVFFWDQEGHECLSGKQVEAIKKAILVEADLSDVDDFRGLTACMGKAVGPVKVLKSSTEIGKVQEGDIIVAVMTRPDYIPAMKKASAIVTDEGGVTCHAAIVSRELGIPCIIGTKIATKVLKDGMQVEVNANHGWVRKVHFKIRPF